MAKKLTKEQKQKQILKWARNVAQWYEINKTTIATVTAGTGKPLPPPPPEP